MSLDDLLQTIPEYAKDLKLNLSSILRQTELTPQQLWGTSVASAHACGHGPLLAAILAEAAKNIDPSVIEAAKSAAAIMGMNNIYYRFLHLAHHEKYTTIPARLRMNVIRMHGIPQVDFELFCTAVSAIHGCGSCIESHDRVVREKGLAEESVLAAIRIAAVIHAVARVLNTEDGLSSAAASSQPAGS